MKNEYGNESIVLLEGAIRVRKNPQNFLGSRELDGAKHTLYEIIGNATDEALSGFGNALDVVFGKDGSISIRDYGRGVPLGYNSNYGKWNYFLIYEELFAGSKYDDNQEILKKIDSENKWSSFNFKDFPYLISIGMNGVGGACTQFTSEWFEVYSYHNGKVSHMSYRKGAHVLDELEVSDTSEPNGTLVAWKPDAEVFDDVNIPASWVENLCKTVSVTTGMTVNFRDESRGKSFEFKGTTITEEMKSLCDGVCAYNKLFYHTRDKRDDVCICEVEVAVGNQGGSPKYFNNMIEIHGGSHSLGLSGALYKFFLEIGAANAVKIREVDYSGKFSFIVKTLANKMSLRGQTKDSLDDQYIQYAIETCIYEMLMREFSKGTKWLLDLIDDVLYACNLRIAQENLIKEHRELDKTIKRHKVSNKFSPSDSYVKGISKGTEYIIVEGDSAGGRAKTARSYAYQCIMPVRGKSLNVYKASIEKLVANQEIKDIIVSLGCGIDLGIDGYESFDIDRLKVSAIYFLPDADIDGKHIAMLLFLIFYKLFPELLYRGYVYVIDTPLYTVNLRNGDPIFCMSQEEMEQAKVDAGANFMSVDRFKGLGETDAETLWSTTLNPETRHVRQLKINRNDMEMVDALELLFGKSTDRRKSILLGSLIHNFDEVIDGTTSIDDFLKELNLNEGYLEYEEVEVE